MLRSGDRRSAGDLTPAAAAGSVPWAANPDNARLGAILPRPGSPGPPGSLRLNGNRWPSCQRPGRVLSRHELASRSAVANTKAENAPPASAHLGNAAPAGVAGCPSACLPWPGPRDPRPALETSHRAQRPRLAMGGGAEGERACPRTGWRSGAFPTGRSRRPDRHRRPAPAVSSRKWQPADGAGPAAGDQSAQ